MSDDKPSNIVLKNVRAEGNLAGGIRIKGVSANLENVETLSNGGVGLDIQASPPAQNTSVSATDPWYRKPIGIVGLAIASGLLLAAANWTLSHYFG